MREAARLVRAIYPPVQVTKRALARAITVNAEVFGQVRIGDLRTRGLERLPRTQAMFAEVIDSGQAFTSRRAAIERAVRSLGAREG